MIDCGAEDQYTHKCEKCGAEFPACKNHPPVRCPHCSPSQLPGEGKVATIRLPTELPYSSPPTFGAIYVNDIRKKLSVQGFELTQGEIRRVLIAACEVGIVVPYKAEAPPTCTYRFAASLGGDVCGKTEDDPEAYHDDKDPEPCCGWHRFSTEQSEDAPTFDERDAGFLKALADELEGGKCCSVGKYEIARLRAMAKAMPTEQAFDDSKLRAIVKDKDDEIVRLEEMLLKRRDVKMERCDKCHLLFPIVDMAEYGEAGSDDARLYLCGPCDRTEVITHG